MFPVKRFGQRAADAAAVQQNLAKVLERSAKKSEKHRGSRGHDPPKGTRKRRRPGGPDAQEPEPVKETRPSGQSFAEAREALGGKRKARRRGKRGGARNARDERASKGAAPPTPTPAASARDAAPVVLVDDPALRRPPRGADAAERGGALREGRGDDDGHGRDDGGGSDGGSDGGRDGGSDDDRHNRHDGRDDIRDGGRAPPDGAAEDPPGGAQDDAAARRSEQEALAKARRRQEMEVMQLGAELSLERAAAAWRLDAHLARRLEEEGVERFFPIQTAAIPHILASCAAPNRAARDVVVCAPTGSGKTLTYAIPIIQSLMRVTVRRLRALVLLPSRALAVQVATVLRRYAEGTDLRVGLATGGGAGDPDGRSGEGRPSADFASEQRRLCGAAAEDAPPRTGGVAEVRLREGQGRGGAAAARGGRSEVDILVATPGRLVHHLDHTPGFTLQHLAFLVVDEADRLLSRSYQNWARRVLEAAHLSSAPGHGGGRLVDPVSLRSRGRTAGGPALPLPLRRMLFSATMTRDPGRLAALDLFYPMYFTVRAADEAESPADFAVPTTLREAVLTVPRGADKPLYLAALLDALLDDGGAAAAGVVLVFANSIESAHRLARLLQLMALLRPEEGAAGSGLRPAGVGDYSGNQPAKALRAVLAKAQAGSVRVLVASDGAARGLDLPSCAAVVHFDAASAAEQYVHRCGRTARAGREGTAVTLLRESQGAAFARLRRRLAGGAGGEQLEEFAGLGGKERVRSLGGVYEKSLGALKEVIAAEEAGDLQVNATLSAAMFK